MGLDWLEIELLSSEFASRFAGSRIQDIYHPTAHQVLLTFYGDGQKNHWIIQLDPAMPCLYPVISKGKMPQTPTAFCQKLRKHLENTTLTNVTPVACDRIFKMEFQSNEGGFQLWCDFRPHSINLHLTDDEGKALISLNSRKTKEDLNSESLLHPLPSFEEIDWIESEVDEALLKVDTHYFTSKARELTPKFITWLSTQPRVINFLEFVRSNLQKVREAHVRELWIDDLGVQDFNIYPDHSWAHKKVIKESLGEVFREYFPEFEQRRLLRKVKTRVISSMEKEIKRLEKRVLVLEEKKIAYQEYELIEQKASLLSSQREKVQPFSNSALLINFFDEYRSIKIDLDARLTVSQNVDQYYKRARKYKRGIPRVEDQIKDLHKTAKALERELERFKHETDLQKIEERFHSLQGMGLIAKKQDSRSGQEKKPKASSLRSFMSTEGSRIFSGRSDKENDYIRKSIGHKEDLWFHVEGAPGSHVLLKKSENMTGTSIREAAQLAAYYSKKKYEGKARVLFTELKHVKGIPGEPGKVLLENCQSLTVRLDHGIIAKLRTLPVD